MALQFSRAHLISLYGPAFILAASNGLVIPALPVLAHSLSISFAMATLALGSLVLGSALSAIPVGYLLDRFGRRGVTIAGLLLVAASGLLMTTATSLPQIMIYQLLAGCGSQMWMLGRLTLIGAQSKAEDRGRQVTGMMAMEQTGQLVGPAIGGGLTAAFGPATTFGVRGVLCLGAALMVYLATRAAAKELQLVRAASKAAVPLTMFQMLKTEPLPKLTILQLITSLARGCVFSGAFDLFMVYAYGVGPATVGLLRSILGAICLPITLSAGHVMDRYGRKAAIIPGFILMTIGMTALAIVSYLDLHFYYFVGWMTMLNMSLSLTSGSMQTLGIDLAPPEWSGKFLGFLRLSTEFGHFLSPTTFALISSHLGYPAAFVFLAGASATVATMVAKAKWMPNHLRRKKS